MPDSHYVAELHFDAETEARLASVSDALRSAGLEQNPAVQGMRPHVTLAGSEAVDVDGMREGFMAVAKGVPAFSIMLSYCGMFFPPSATHVILYAGVTPCAELARLHHDLFSLVERRSSGRVYDFTAPGQTVFHSTLAGRMDEGDLAPALRIVRPFFPCRAVVRRLALVRYYPAVEQYGQDLPTH